MKPRRSIFGAPAALAILSLLAGCNGGMIEDVTKLHLSVVAVAFGCNYSPALRRRK